MLCEADLVAKRAALRWLVQQHPERTRASPGRGAQDVTLVEKPGGSGGCARPIQMASGRMSSRLPTLLTLAPPSGCTVRCAAISMPRPSGARGGSVFLPAWLACHAHF
jgi:hypothetical protein